MTDKQHQWEFPRVFVQSRHQSTVASILARKTTFIWKVDFRGFVEPGLAAEAAADLANRAGVAASLITRRCERGCSKERAIHYLVLA